MTSPSLRICDDYQLEMSAFERTGLRVGIWASSGRGKSFGVGVFCEELLGAGVPIVAIDPEGELYTLREQFRALVLGGAHADLDLPVTPTGIRAAIDMALDAAAGLVVDLSDLATTKAQQEAARPWLEQLWARMSERRALAALVVEEVHLFAPQSGSATTADMMQRFAKQGRKRGAILVAASQRTQAVSKEFMSQLNFPAIGGFETERDYEAVRAVVDGHPFDDFRGLPVGQFFLPAAGGFHRWRSRSTSHGGEAPAWASDEAREDAPRDAALQALVAELRKALEEDARQAAAQHPDAALQARIHQLENELRRTQRALSDSQAEVERLNMALQIAGVIKVVIRQEVITQVKEAAATLAPPAPAPAPVPAAVAAPAPAPVAVRAPAAASAAAPAPAVAPAPAAASAAASAAVPAAVRAPAPAYSYSSVSSSVSSSAPVSAPVSSSVAGTVRTQVRAAEASFEDVGLSAEKLLELEAVKKVLQVARTRARRRAPRAGIYVISAMKMLAKGWQLNATELAERFGFHGKETINRMAHALHALAEADLATFSHGRYRMNEAGLRRIIAGG